LYGRQKTHPGLLPQRQALKVAAADSVRVTTGDIDASDGHDRGSPPSDRWLTHSVRGPGWMRFRKRHPLRSKRVFWSERTSRTCSRVRRAHLVAVERAGLIEVEGLVSISDEERPSLSLTQRGVERMVVRRWMSDEDIVGSVQIAS